MRLTLKKEATKPTARNFSQQQARFDEFIEVYNNQRPHEALDMKCLVEIYQPSPRPYSGLPAIDYPFHDRTIVVTHCGRICLGRKKINFSTVFAGQAVGIKEIHDDIWLVSFMDYDLGYFDLETRVLEPLENPFGPKVLPILAGTLCYLCLRVGPQGIWSGRWESNPRPKLGKLLYCHCTTPALEATFAIIHKQAWGRIGCGDIEIGSVIWNCSVPFLRPGNTSRLATRRWPLSGSCPRAASTK